jgi:predicted membrane chloride channel (bestrophin family)
MRSLHTRAIMIGTVHYSTSFVVGLVAFFLTAVSAIPDESHGNLLARFFMLLVIIL